MASASPTRTSSPDSTQRPVHTPAGTLGIIAGAGPFPGYVIERCAACGIPHFVLALKGFTDPRALESVPHGWARLGAGGRSLRLLRRAGVAEITVIGSLRRPSVLQFWPDLVMIGAMLRIGWRALFGGDDALIKAALPVVESKGLRIIPVEAILPELLATEGCYGRVAPDETAEQDIAYGFEIAREVGRADVGQGAVVEQGLVLAREDASGTDAMLAKLAGHSPHGRSGPGGVLVKTAKPGQQRKVDLPTIGTATVNAAAAAGLRGIAIEAGSALVVDREGVVAAADEAGLFVVGVRAMGS
ncbi:MAG: UDP-2,3-diacylglucosamine diphosphatase LpxI [Alphaproteobacteria bacterium]|nr:UDP-2,3-diacylglucosamine diphosphatase LpxI [Alphaproteobacteria bacterium]